MEQTKTESRKEFIKYCLINPILEASKKGIEFNLSDNHVGMSLFHILVDKGYVSDHIDNMKPYFDKAESKIAGIKESVVTELPTGKLSMKNMLKQITPTRKNLTEEQREETMMLAYYYVSSEWIDKARKEGVNLYEVLKYNE